MSIQPTVHHYIVEKNEKDRLVLEEMHKKYAEEIRGHCESSSICFASACIRYRKEISQLGKEARSYLVSEKEHRINDMIEIVISRKLVEQNLQAILRRNIRIRVLSGEDSGTYGSMGIFRRTLNISR